MGSEAILIPLAVLACYLPALSHAIVARWRRERALYRA
jgi:hypothetical protein